MWADITGVGLPLRPAVLPLPPVSVFAGVGILFTGRGRWNLPRDIFARTPSHPVSLPRGNIKKIPDIEERTSAADQSRRRQLRHVTPIRVPPSGDGQTNAKVTE